MKKIFLKIGFTIASALLISGIALPLIISSDLLPLPVIVLLALCALGIPAYFVTKWAFDVWPVVKELIKENDGRL